MHSIENVLKERILVLDGAMGTVIQEYGLQEKDFSSCCSCNSSQKGNNDLLNLTRPDIIKSIHEKYLEAGANIIETNTLNSNRISQADFGMEDKIYEINYNGAKLAKEASNKLVWRDESPNERLYWWFYRNRRYWSIGNIIIGN